MIELLNFHNQMDFLLELRQKSWQRLFSTLKSNAPDHRDSNLKQVGRIGILAASSRGGTSVTSELLQWQGANCSDNRRRMLTLPGEEKPHLILSGLAFPARTELYDDLEAHDANKEKSLSILFAEMASEIGYPMAECNDFVLYGTQLYRRLLLQWPQELARLDMDESINLLIQALRQQFPNGYIDSTENRRTVLQVCKRCFHFIKTSFYDCASQHFATEVDILTWPHWSIEEPPFVLPTPWHNASQQEMDNGCLLLRDPSNAWRLSFWRSVFPKQQMEVLHLIRDPRESIQGLCDGWNYPFGFQTIVSDFPLDISGYTDGSSNGSNGWKQHRLNFSISRNLSYRLLVKQEAMNLVQICGHQWLEAHERIIADANHHAIERKVIHFSDLRSYPEATYKKMCRSLNLEVSASGLDYARTFPNRWVMATSAASPVSHERWKNSPYTDEIKLITTSAGFSNMKRQLGIEKSRVQYARFDKNIRNIQNHSIIYNSQNSISISIPSDSHA